MKHLLILLKTIILTILLFIIFDALYIGYLYYLAEFKGTLGIEIKELKTTLDDKPIGFGWGEVKTYSLLGFIFVVLWIREYV